MADKVATWCWWQTCTCNEFDHVSDSLNKIWKYMVDNDLYNIYCKEDGKAGRLILTREELSDTINFLKTVKYMEELGNDSTRSN